MNKKSPALLPAFALLFSLLLVSDAEAQRPRAQRPRARPSNILNLLPASDAVIFVDVRRLLNQAIPGVYAGNQAKLAQVNAQIDKFKAQTGVDPRAFERLAVGLRYTYPAPGVTKVESVAIARGTFNPGALVSAARIAAKGQLQEQKYKGATIYVCSLNDQIRLLGFFNLRVNDLAVSVLDANTLALGSPANVRAAIDASRAGKRASSELIALAMSDPNALIGFGGNVSPAVWRNLGADMLAKEVSSIRQVYGSLGMKGTSFSVSLVARTSTPAQALGLSETVAGLKQLGGMFLGRLPEARKKLAQSALDNLKVSAPGNELRISTEVLQADVASVLRP